MCLRIKNQKDTNKFVRDMRKAVGSLFDRPNLWFKGVGLNTLALLCPSSFPSFPLTL